MRWEGEWILIIFCMRKTHWKYIPLYAMREGTQKNLAKRNQSKFKICHWKKKKSQNKNWWLQVSGYTCKELVLTTWPCPNTKLKVEQTEKLLLLEYIREGRTLGKWLLPKLRPTGKYRDVQLTGTETQGQEQLKQWREPVLGVVKLEL